MGISRLGNSSTASGSGRKRSNRIGGGISIFSGQTVTSPGSVTESTWTGSGGEKYRVHLITTTQPITVNGDGGANPATIQYSRSENKYLIGSNVTAGGGIDVLVQAGGGGGGCWVAGGGGGGATVVMPNFTAPAGATTITVGGGGQGHSNPGNMPSDMGGQRGGDSIAFGYVAKGGGTGSTWDQSQRVPGGNGGGGSSNGPVGSSTQPTQNGPKPGNSFTQYGNPGNSNGNPTSHGSAGGGGSGENPHNNSQDAKNGNDGRLNQWLDGSNRYYGAGGGQGTHDGGYSDSPGGLGGGGTGYSGTQFNPGANATHYGGGGGGCGRTGGQSSTGGSGYAGVVIIRHQYLES